MTLGANHISAIENKLAEYDSAQPKIIHTQNISGGCINACYQIKTTRQKVFVKINSAEKFPGMFATESLGLTLLGTACKAFVPQVVTEFSAGDYQYLILEYIEATSRKADYNNIFAQQLAQVHAHSATQFGLEYPNYIGSLQQINTPTERWSDFFIQNRLQPLLRMAVDNKQFDIGIISQFEKLYPKLDAIFPQEKPALLHGDLWGGNHITGNDGYGKIIDPAVYYGHREMDIAMMHLFGGFDHSLVKYYHEIYPLENGWQQRIDICNLYPLLVHVLLFGGGYVNSVKQRLNRFV